jgi:hypothetical protein
MDDVGGEVGDVGGEVGDVGGEVEVLQSVAAGALGSPDETPRSTGVNTLTGALGAGTVQMTVPVGADDASMTSDPTVISASASVVVACSSPCPMTSGIGKGIGAEAEQLVPSGHPGYPVETTRSTADP